MNPTEREELIARQVSLKGILRFILEGECELALVLSGDHHDWVRPCEIRELLTIHRRALIVEIKDEIQTINKQLQNYDSNNRLHRKSRETD